MIKKQYHILNGDALKVQFPKQIFGELIVAKECMVDGSVKGKGLPNLYATRALYLSRTYGGTEKDYYLKVVSEFDKIQSIPEGSEINLWFEDDLFCQVNLWFVLHLLNQQFTSKTICLVRPKSDMRYGFGGMSTTDLVQAFSNKMEIELSSFKLLSKLWKHYQEANFEEMMKIAKELESQYPFLAPALEAHIERFPKGNRSGRPEQSLLNIMNEFETKDFAVVFKEFCKREEIYGFGDLQVKKLFDEIIKN